MSKKNNHNSNGGMVYSTNPDFSFNSMDSDDFETLEPGAQNLRIWLDRHKGGKVSTVIRGFVGKESDLEALAKRLKTSCGVGGGAKDGEIILQGDVRPRITKELDKSGYRYKLAGG